MRAMTVAVVALTIAACRSASPEADEAGRVASRAEVVAAMDRYDGVWLIQRQFRVPVATATNP
jgi:hypothetical protein